MHCRLLMVWQNRVDRPGGIGKEVKFWLVLVPTKNCPDSCIETHVQVLDCPSNVHCDWAPFLRCWTDFGCQEKQVGSLLGGSYPLLARSILAGNLQAWVGVVCTPPLLIHVLLVHSVYLIFYRNTWCVCPGWSLTKIKSSAFKRSFHCENIDNGRYYAFGRALVL